MKAISGFLCVLLLVLASASIAGATVTASEYIYTVNEGWFERGSPSMEFEWSKGCQVVSDSYHIMVTNYPASAPSPINANYDGSSTLLVLSSVHRVDFLGAYSDAWSISETRHHDPQAPGSITIADSYDGIQIGSVSLDRAVYNQRFDVNPKDSNESVFASTSAISSKLMNDLTFKNVPFSESAYFLLLGASMLGMAGIGRKRFFK